MSGVVGLDLSLTSTGVGLATVTNRITPRKLPEDTPIEHPLRAARIESIKSAVIAYLEAAEPELVVVEGPSHGSKGGNPHERGGLWWAVRVAVADRKIPFMVATPGMLKKYATGKGGGAETGKDMIVLATARRFDWFEGNNDEADALWACAMGYEWLGRPIVQMPAVNREALKTWGPVSAAA